MTRMTMVEALNRGLKEAMAEDERIIVLGEDVGVDGGVFRVTDELIDEFGDDRVLDTPLAESGIVGFCVGLAVAGLRPVAELQFSGFSYFGFHQIEAHVARMRWRTGGGLTTPMVIRMPYGAGVRALEHHSESREVYYAHTPGLKTVIPSNPSNARALLKSAIRDPDPVIFLEPKFLYRSERAEVSDDDPEMEIGVANVAREGSDLTLIGYGAMMPALLECAERLSESRDAEAEVIDLLSLSPLDDGTVAESVMKTGRAVVVHEAPRSFGPAGEIASRISERCFYHLEAPVGRVTGYDIITPYFAREKLHMPGVERIFDAAVETLEARA